VDILAAKSILGIFLHQEHKHPILILLETDEIKSIRKAMGKLTGVKTVENRQRK
jgi:hypothetical protein